MLFEPCYRDLISSQEANFYALPYGTLWEQTHDFVERYFMDEFSSARIVYPAGSNIAP